MKTGIIFLLAIAFSTINTFSQIHPIGEKLTKEQMYEDFDEFVQIIEDINIQAHIREKVTGYDVTEQIRQQRSKIENIHSYWEFVDFLTDCLSCTFSVHASIATDYEGTGWKNIDTQYVSPFAIGYKEHKQQIRIQALKNHRGMSIGKTFYYNGDYYIYGTQKMIKVYSEKKDTIVVSDMKLLSCNNQPIDSIVWGKIGDTNPTTVRWDYRQKKYYVDWLLISSPMRIWVEDYPTKKQYVLPLDSLGIHLSYYSLSDSAIALISHREKSDNTKITYYEDIKLLYIYLNSMADDGGVFVDSIKQIGNGKIIDKIIIDVRDNVGGSDYTWIRILQAIIKNPIPQKGNIVMKDNERMWKHLNSFKEEKEIKETMIQKGTIPFFDNLKIISITDEDTLYPDSNSLGYNGNIYILQNEKVYSAGQAFVAYARQVPQLISVGVPTGNIAGEGFDRPIFQLSHSKYSFHLDATADMTNAKTAEDMFHDRPEIEIYPTIDEIIEMNNYGHFLNKRGDEFLFKHDYLFKKVLEMK
jgi:hypothetical protein